MIYEQENCFFTFRSFSSKILSLNFLRTFILINFDCKSSYKLLNDSNKKNIDNQAFNAQSKHNLQLNNFQLTT